MVTRTSKTTTLERAAGLVEDGCRIGFAGQPALARRPMAFVRELIRQQRSGLHVFNMIGGLEVDLLLGAGAVASTNCCYVGLGDLGQSPHFQRAAQAHTVRIEEYSEFTLVASLRAAGMNLPFIPWKTGWGSELARRQGWKTVVCPYTGIDLLAIPANELDVAVIQVARADRSGNVELPLPLELSYDFDYLIGRAAKRVIVCAERVEEIPDPSRVAMIGREVDCVVHAPHGAWPCGLGGEYAPDIEHLTGTYLPATATPAAFAGYLREHVLAGERRR
jgi:glutaconate CoA-transferase, subunit A